mgnify:CR=1 FL=1
MNSYIKKFFHRGLIFGGFGPIIMGIIYAILQKTVPDFSLSGSEVCLAIISIYILAFIQAGASVFNQIEHWPITKSLFFHFGSLYLAYVICYLLNSWIPFKAEVVIIFTAVFIGIYFAVWLTVYFSVKTAEKKLNRKLS